MYQIQRSQQHNNDSIQIAKVKVGSFDPEHWTLGTFIRHVKFYQNSCIYYGKEVEDVKTYSDERFIE